MRTTLTLDPDAEALVRRLMRQRKISFKQAVNDAIRAGVAPSLDRPPFRTPTFDLGPARVDLDRALHVAAELEDEAIGQKLALLK